ncbi:MAG TPA: glycine cleavage system protein GcvH [Bacteroidales bacterium]|jgi:glycine cleavage system H protein|nr:glycine cleavage system protein GcvH [Bacteroidales bacterium]
MNIPENLFYTEDHEWIKVDGDYAIIGITDYAQKELGDIVFIEIETLDEELDRGESFGTIEAVKTVSDLFMPMAGKVVELNENLESDPEVINNDPYGEGWIIKLKITNSSQLDELLDHSAYSKNIGD